MDYREVKVGLVVRWPLQDAMRGPHLFEVVNCDTREKKSVLVRCVSGVDSGERFHLSPDWLVPVAEAGEQGEVLVVD